MYCTSTCRICRNLPCTPPLRLFSWQIPVQVLTCTNGILNFPEPCLLTSSHQNISRYHFNTSQTKANCKVLHMTDTLAGLWTHLTTLLEFRGMCVI